MTDEIRKYISYLESKGFTKGTLKTHKSNVNKLNQFFKDESVTDIFHIDKSTITGLKKYLSCKKFSKATIRNCINELKYFTKYLYESNRLKFNPLKQEKEEYPATIKKTLQEFELFLSMKGFKPRGIEGMLRNAGYYLKYAQMNNLNISGAGIRECEKYREDMALQLNNKGDARYNPKTINCAITHLRSLYVFFIHGGYALRNPFLNIEKLKESYHLPKNILTIEEMKKLLDGAEVKTKADFKFKVILELLYSTGCRISEVEKLRKEDIDLEKGIIRVKDDKERKDRIAPLTECCSELLSLYLKYYDGFKQGKNRTLNTFVNNRLKKLTGKLKVTLITAHGIRHTIATHLFKKGADIREVQEFLGHRLIKNTEVYTRIFVEDLKNVIEKTHPREMDK